MNKAFLLYLLDRYRIPVNAWSQGYMVPGETEGTSPNSSPFPGSRRQLGPSDSLEGLAKVENGIFFYNLSNIRLVSLSVLTKYKFKGTCIQNIVSPLCDDKTLAVKSMCIFCPTNTCIRKYHIHGVYVHCIIYF